MELSDLTKNLTKGATILATVATLTFSPLLAKNADACSKDALLCTNGTVLERDPANNCEFPACPEDYMACTKDALLCDDGTVLGRDPANNCEFPLCPEDYVACTKDAFLCDDGTVLGRDPANNCEFPACPTENYTVQACSKELLMCASGLKFGRDGEKNCAFPTCDEAYLLSLRALDITDANKIGWSSDGILFNPTSQDMEVTLYATPRSTKSREVSFDQENDPSVTLTVKAKDSVNLNEHFLYLLQGSDAKTIRIIPGEGKYVGGQSNGTLPLGYNSITNNNSGEEVGFTEAMQTVNELYSEKGATLHTIIPDTTRRSFIFSIGTNKVEGVLSYDNPQLNMHFERELEFNYPNSTYQLHTEDIKQILGADSLPPGGILSYKVDLGKIGIEMTVTEKHYTDAYAVPFMEDTSCKVTPRLRQLSK